MSLPLKQNNNKVVTVSSLYLPAVSPHAHAHARTLPSGQTRQSGRGEAGINDTMISRPDLSVELRERMRRRRMKRRRGER